MYGTNVIGEMVDYFSFRMFRWGGIPAYFATFLLIAAILLSALRLAKRIPLYLIMVAWQLTLLAAVFGFMRSFNASCGTGPVDFLSRFLCSLTLMTPTALLTVPALYLSLDRKTAVLLFEDRIVVASLFAWILDVLLLAVFLTYAVYPY